MPEKVKVYASKNYFTGVLFGDLLRCVDVRNIEMILLDR
jgi:hypothetical protein